MFIEAALSFENWGVSCSSSPHLPTPLVSNQTLNPTTAPIAPASNLILTPRDTDPKMRFRTELKNIRTFAKLTAALSSLEKIAWVRLSDDTVRFTVIPDMGSQVWASLAMDLIFQGHHIQSAESHNTINLELPLQPLQRALKSALNSISASLRLTKKDGLPILSMTITTTTSNVSSAAVKLSSEDPFGDDVFEQEHLETSLRREHEKIITQDIPVRVLHPVTVETIMQPRVREPDVHIQLPPLLQLKAISDRFTKLALDRGKLFQGTKIGTQCQYARELAAANSH
ncbi:Checkpoint protein hus1 [Metarhizium acridum]|uniref:Checkpoint protein hus1 n=1 Tax=Metarhizium acridum TaxID=92637 RepID=UPI001C6B9E55|nr:Checkpoint protein hus1 [Metarhizium acridum]